MDSRNKLTMCRLCLSENECFINIFEMNDWQGYVAAEAISDILQLQVSETDGYPHVVCSKCLMKLTDFRLFKECCQKSKVTYDNIFATSESLVKNQSEMVEIVTIKAEPIYYSDEEDNVSKTSSGHVGTEEDILHQKGSFEAISDPDIIDRDEFKEEPMEDIGVSGLEFCEEDPLRGGAYSDVQLTLAEKAKHSQYLHCLEYKRPYCTSEGAVDADSCTWNVRTNYESIFEKSKNFSLNVGAEASSSRAMERLEEQWIPPGERMYMGPFFQGDMGIGKDGRRKEKETVGDRKGGRGIALEKGSEGERVKLECNHCGKMLMTKRGLVKHMKGHGFGHSFGCDVCGKIFHCKSNLISHIFTHTGTKPYKCPECGKCFSQNGNLNIHMRSHTGSRPYKCKACNKSFSDNSNLKKHMRYHTGAKPYECSECSKRFCTKSNLIIHMRSHTGSKPYICVECGKSFSQSGNLKMHMISHTTSKAYKCVECSKCYSRSDNLKKHMRSHMGSNI